MPVFFLFLFLFCYLHSFLRMFFCTYCFFFYFDCMNDYPRDVIRP